MMQAFILAGGFATRLWPLTEKRAKPLLPLAGKPIITHLVEQIPPEIPITVSTNATFARAFAEWRTGQSRKDITIVVEKTTKDDEKIGALGATAQWLTAQSIDDDLLLLAGDNYFGFPITTVLEEFHNRKDHVLFAAREVQSIEEAKRFGVVIADEPQNQSPGKKIVRWRAKGFIEKPKDPPSKIVSTGCIVFPKGVLGFLIQYAGKHPDNMGGILDHCIHDQKMEVEYVQFDAPWFDIGSYDAYLEATHVLVSPGKPVIHPTAEVDEKSRRRCAGSVVIGARTRVKDSELINTILFDRCTVTDCSLERCILDDHCTLHGIDLTGKMLRSGTTIKK